MEFSSNFDQARSYALNKLATGLSPQLTYHSIVHTTEEVIPAAERLAAMEKIDGEERMLLLTAAYFHDLGFICQRQDHERISIELAEHALPQFGYTKNQRGIIRGIILATRIPQSPRNLLEMILADADLDYLGHDDFWKRSSDLRRELDYYGSPFNDTDWYLFQLRFIEAHQYFTASEYLLREAIKQQHLAEIHKRLKAAAK